MNLRVGTLIRALVVIVGCVEQEAVLASAVPRPRPTTARLLAVVCASRSCQRMFSPLHAIAEGESLNYLLEL